YNVILSCRSAPSAGACPQVSLTTVVKGHLAFGISDASLNCKKRDSLWHAPWRTTKRGRNSGSRPYPKDRRLVRPRPRSMYASIVAPISWWDRDSVTFVALTATL